MGYSRHHAVIVTASNIYATQFHTVRDKLAQDPVFGRLVSQVISSVTNGKITFFVAPDGSNEGRDRSDQGDRFRDEVISRVSQQVPEADWVVVQYGDDDCVTKIVDDSDRRVREAVDDFTRISLGGN